MKSETSRVENAVRASDAMADAERCQCERDECRDRLELLELLFAQAADALFLAEPEDGRIVEVNAAACAMLGYTKEELLGMYPWDFMTDASREDIFKLWREMQPGVPVTVQRAYRQKTGNQRMMNFRVTRLGCRGRDLLVASCGITEQENFENPLRANAERWQTDKEWHRLNAELERQTVHLKQINQTLMDSEQRLRLALETGRIGLWVWNSTDTRNSGDWSPRLKEIFGLPVDAEVTHDLFLKCVHPDDRERIDQGVRHALSGLDGGEYSTEYRTIHTLDRSEHWVAARGRAFFDAEGRAIRFIGAVMDITEHKRAEESLTRLNLELEARIVLRTADLAWTNQALQGEIEERKRAQEALQHSEDSLRVAIDTIPGLVWSAQPDGHLEYLNQRWIDYTGLTLEEATGWGWQAAIHPEDLPSLLENWRSVLASGMPGETEARLRRFDGEYRWFLFREVPLYDELGNVMKWYGTNTDVESRRASEHLARGQFDALTKTLDALVMESDPDRLVEYVLRTVTKQLEAHSSSLWEKTEETGLLSLAFTLEGGKIVTKPDSGIGTVTLADRVEDVSPWPEVFRTGEPSVLEDIREGPFFPWREGLLAQGIVTVLVIPMLVSGQVQGVIDIRFMEKRTFRAEEMELAQALAHQAMLALRLFRLSRQSRETAVTAERNRMARDIHDTLAQGFTGVIVQLEATKGSMARNDLANATERIERASDLARSSLNEARQSVRALRPRSLREGPLSMALDDLLKRMTEGTSLQAAFQVEGEQRAMPADWEEGLLRIAQESLTNTIKHARARTFRAALSSGARNVQLRLLDDGRGFDPRAEHDGFGLVGMKERVEQMEGQFVVHSHCGQGTEILVVLESRDAETRSRT